MAQGLDKLSLAIVLLSAALVALFLQGFWSIVIYPSYCGGLAWLAALGVLTAVAVFYAYEKGGDFAWISAAVLFVIFAVVALYMTFNAPSIYPTC